MSLVRSLIPVACPLPDQTYICTSISWTYICSVLESVSILCAASSNSCVCISCLSLPLSVSCLRHTLPVRHEMFKVWKDTQLDWHHNSFRNVQHLWHPHLCHACEFLEEPSCATCVCSHLETLRWASWAWITRVLVVCHPTRAQHIPLNLLVDMHSKSIIILAAGKGIDCASLPTVLFAASFL